MNPCISCGLALAPGSSHASSSDCVSALRHALEAATTCVECGTPVPTVLHAGCVPAHVAKKSAGLGVGVVERKIMDAINRKLVGEPPQSKRRRPRDEDEGDFEP